MSKLIEHFGEIIDSIIDLKPSEDRVNKIIEPEIPEEKTNNKKIIKIKEAKIIITN